ncbi:DedA family protein [Planotetraspora phitsanulokensis]|uniref:DedA family protein n=1 Tax=Planotetraspora phitsanulokensis TaxID=575192 RepID=A0A8J3TZR2_9ACTN|nr:DedA family protein [Planotetraspora phitsanulokensis]GII35993.1 DedA family protein [Planotetraspora phitsanulokensis]
MTVAMSGVLPSLSELIAHYGYLAVAALVLLEDFGVPVPGETVLVVSAAYAGTDHLNIAVVAAAGFLAAIAGDSIGYAIGRTGGRRLVTRYGRYMLLTPARFARAEQFFTRHGAEVVVIARFVEGLRQLNGIIAGITGMPWRRFLAYNTAGAALWVGVWATLGYLAGDHLTSIEAGVHRYQWYALGGLILAITAYAAIRLRRHRTRRNPE